jgi:hypothetical protein
MRKWLKEIPERRRSSQIKLLALSAATAVAASTAGMVVNQSILVSRTFYANLAICAPYISDLEEEHIVAKFAGMTGRSSYLQIDQKFKQVAKDNSVLLKDIDLW